MSIDSATATTANVGTAKAQYLTPFPFLSFRLFLNTQKKKEKKQDKRLYLLGRVVCDSHGVEAGLRRVSPDQVHAGGDDGGDGSHEAVHLRRLRTRAQPIRLMPLGFSFRVPEEAPRLLPRAPDHQRRRRLHALSCWAQTGDFLQGRKSEH